MSCIVADAKTGVLPREYLDAAGKLRDDVRAKAVAKARELRRLFHVGAARRTVRTYAGNKGASDPESDAFLGHGKGTGEKHYGRHVPMKVPTLL